MSLEGVLTIRGSAVTIEQPSETAGDAIVTWTTIATVQAQLEGVTGNELGLVAEADYRILMAYRTDITPKMRIGLGTRKFAIVVPPLPDPKRQMLTIFARELV